MRGKHKIQVPNKRCRVSGFLFMLPAPLSLCSVENQFFCLFGRLEVQFFFGLLPLGIKGTYLPV